MISLASRCPSRQPDTPTSDTATSQSSDQACLNRARFPAHTRQFHPQWLLKSHSCAGWDGFREACNGCGLRLLTILYKKATDIGVTEAGRIQASMHTQFMAGLASPTILGFNDFRTTFGASTSSSWTVLTVILPYCPLLLCGVIATWPAMRPDIAITSVVLLSIV